MIDASWTAMLDVLGDRLAESLFDAFESDCTEVPMREPGSTDHTSAHLLQDGVRASLQHVRAQYAPLEAFPLPLVAASSLLDGPSSVHPLLGGLSRVQQLVVCKDAWRRRRAAVTSWSTAWPAHGLLD
jgi:hypothetical protein